MARGRRARGTSMGAIVGGLYASGYTTSQLDSIFRNTDFDQIIQDNLPRSAKTFYEKEAAERYALTLPFSKFKVSIPAAFSGGQNIYNELVRVLYHVKDVRDFNQLPIPFFCIATDVETGEELLLDEGYLPEAIMASGTLPSLFEPMEVDGRILTRAVSFKGEAFFDEATECRIATYRAQGDRIAFT